MGVYRINKKRGYTVMANFHLRDKNLSLKAVGLLSKMLSFNDGWKFSKLSCSFQSLADASSANFCTS